MGLCPAAVQIDAAGRPTILVNSLTFGVAPEYAQRFYLAHELGHWLLGTSSEEAADAFALGLLAGTEHRSLKKCLESLNRLHTIPYPRLEALYQRCTDIERKNKKFNL